MTSTPGPRSKKQKPATLRQWLHACRCGWVTFDEFERGTRSTWEKLAGYFYRRWPEQASVSQQDVAQEVLLAVWRAVMKWDPHRGVSIERFVWYQAGVAGQRAMARAHSYSRVHGVRWHVPLPKQEQAAPAQQHRVAAAREHLEMESRRPAVRGSLEREVATALLEGRSLEDVAREVYADPVSRYEYWLGSEAEAEARVRAAARRIGTRAAGAA